MMSALLQPGPQRRSEAEEKRNRPAASKFDAKKTNAIATILNAFNGKVV
jgi:hypothetical protein